MCLLLFKRKKKRKRNLNLDFYILSSDCILDNTADGITYTLGIFLVEFMKDFKVGSEATSWIASILVAVTLGSGT